MRGWGIFNFQTPQPQALGIKGGDLGCRLSHGVTVTAEPTLVTAALAISVRGAVHTSRQCQAESVLCRKWPFEEVNKSVSLLATNIPFIRDNLSPLSFIDVPDDSTSRACSAFMGSIAWTC